LRLVPKQKLKDTNRALKALEALSTLDFRSLLCAAGFQLLHGGPQALRLFLERQR